MQTTIQAHSKLTRCRKKCKLLARKLLLCISCTYLLLHIIRVTLDFMLSTSFEFLRYLTNWFYVDLHLNFHFALTYYGERGRRKRGDGVFARTIFEHTLTLSSPQPHESPTKPRLVYGDWVWRLKGKDMLRCRIRGRGLHAAFLLGGTHSG